MPSDWRRLFSGRLSIWVWGRDRKKPVFYLPWDQAGKCVHFFSWFNRTHFSTESHLFQLSLPTYGQCYLLWGSCSSYSWRNNRIFLTSCNLNEWERSYPYYCCDVISVMCVCINCICKIFMGRREIGPLLYFLLNLCPVSFFYQNICQTKPPNCLWFGNLV